MGGSEFDKKVLQERIIKARKKIKMNQAQLAEKSGVTPAAISQIEKGSRVPTIPVLHRIASVLNVSLDYLAGSTDESELADLLQHEKVMTYHRGLESLDPEDKETIYKNIEFLISRYKDKNASGD